VSNDLLDNYASALRWNQPSPAVFWFHYTSRPAAREIVETGVFEVGTRHAAGRAGIYVCPYQPGSLSEEELARRILDGSFYERRRLQAAVVLVAGSRVAFTSDPGTVDGMRYLADPGSRLRLFGQIIGFAERVGSQWRHSQSCFDAALLRTLTRDGPPSPSKGSAGTL
jgi:hypothetical protein